MFVFIPPEALMFPSMQSAFGHTKPGETSSWGQNRIDQTNMKTDVRIHIEGFKLHDSRSVITIELIFVIFWQAGCQLTNKLKCCAMIQYPNKI